MSIRATLTLGSGWTVEVHDELQLSPLLAGLNARNPITLGPLNKTYIGP